MGETGDASRDSRVGTSSPSCSGEEPREDPSCSSAGRGVTSPQARKGAHFERAVVECLRAHGHRYAERAYGAGRPEDVGDIDGILGVVLECKAHRSIDLAGFMDEAERERVNAGAEIAVVVVKRRQKPVGQSYAVLTLDALAELLRLRSES